MRSRTLLFYPNRNSTTLHLLITRVFLLKLLKLLSHFHRRLLKFLRFLLTNFQKIYFFFHRVELPSLKSFHKFLKINILSNLKFLRFPNLKLIRNPLNFFIFLLLILMKTKTDLMFTQITRINFLQRLQY